MTVRIQTEDFNLAKEVEVLLQGRSDIGACVTFTGLVRSEKGEKSVADMTLEHYPGMTEAELKRIETEACKRWSLQTSLIVHRVGKLIPGDQIVLVIAAAAHRHAAFEAAQFMMDFLKSDAPFWKKETLKDGSADWVDCRKRDAAAIRRWSKR